MFLECTLGASPWDRPWRYAISLNRENKKCRFAIIFVSTYFVACWICAINQIYVGGDDSGMSVCTIFPIRETESIDFPGFLVALLSIDIVFLGYLELLCSLVFSTSLRADCEGLPSAYLLNSRFSHIFRNRYGLFPCVCHLVVDVLVLYGRLY